jgi:hypothetical protein
MIFIILCIIIILLLILITIININNVNNLDSIVRKNNDCTPISKETIGDYQIWTVPNTCEDGMPHTIDKNTIIFPQYLNNIPKTDRDSIISHEKVHLDQKRNIIKWKDFYEKSWNYKLYSKPPLFIPNHLIKYKRHNPDTSDFPWTCWNNIWWSIPIYTDNTIKNAKVVWYNQIDNNIYNIAPKEWTEFFNSNNIINQSEHPHEISAIYIAKNNYETKASKLLYNFLQ